MQLDAILARIDHSSGWDTCWPWTGARLPREDAAYGMVRYEGKLWRVHRLVWALAHGPLADGEQVLHRCDNPPCCNWWAHLFIGDPAINAADKVAKGRASGGKNYGNQFWRQRHWRGGA